MARRLSCAREGDVRCLSRVPLCFPPVRLDTSSRRLAAQRILEKNPDAQPIISLGIGDTTMPVPKHILNGLTTGASKLGTKEGYSGYGAEQGQGALREKIAANLYDNRIDPSEVSSRTAPSATLAGCR